MQGPDSRKNVAFPNSASGYEYPSVAYFSGTLGYCGYSYPEAGVEIATFLLESGPCMGRKAGCLLKMGTRAFEPLHLIGAQKCVTFLALKHYCRAVVLRH